MGDTSRARAAVYLGIPAGFGAIAAYGLVAASSEIALPEEAVMGLAIAFGPLLLISSYGIYHAINFHRRMALLDLALVFNVAAGVLVTTMLLVQFGTSDAYPPSDARDANMAATVTMVDRVQLSLDVAWDVFISLGTILFGWSMLRHPRFGPLVGLTGMGVGSALLYLNLATFPRPPAEAGLFDLGPLVGLWYLIVSICLLFSLGWIRKAGA